MGQSKIDRIRERLKIPLSVPIPVMNKLSHYCRETGERKEMTIINSCYHIAHSKQFTAFFSSINNITDNENENNENENEGDGN